MALTLNELSDLVETLQKKVDTLETEVKQYRQDFLDLEQQQSESITTQKLTVIGDAQISGRNVQADGTRLDTHENRLNSHDISISSAQGTANDAVNGANNAQGTANDAVNRANNAQGTANTAAALANTAQVTANIVQNSVAPFVNSTVLLEFINQVQFKVRSDGYNFFVFPNLYAWDIYANGQFYSANNFIPNSPNNL
jgi:hypothetical protein